MGISVNLLYIQLFIKLIHRQSFDFIVFARFCRKYICFKVHIWIDPFVNRKFLSDDCFFLFFARYLLEICVWLVYDKYIHYVRRIASWHSTKENPTSSFETAPS